MSIGGSWAEWDTVSVWTVRELRLLAFGAGVGGRGAVLLVVVEVDGVLLAATASAEVDRAG